MNKLSLLSQRIPVLVKMLYFFLLLWAVLFFGIFRLLEAISQYLWINYKLVLSVEQLAKTLHLNFMLLFAGLICLLVGIFSLDIFQFVRRIQRLLKESLVDRQLSESLPQFLEKRSFNGATQNLMSLLSLYRSFDHMKSSRIALEMTTIKTLINHTRQAVLLVNQEKVVTHINHTGEHMLKLIPGEIIGQAISRKISHKDFLANLDEALEFDKKVIEVPISFKDETFFMDILPLKNKFGEVVRALILLDAKIERVEEHVDL
jgi:hypothetical protein